MGNESSITSRIDQQNVLINKIQDIALELSETYNSKFLDPAFCTKIALIYTNKLNNFRRNELEGVAYDLGLVVDQPQLKDNICQSIVKHYTDRLNLIAAIQHSLSFCSNRIFALTSGPRCEGNPEVFNQAACTKGGSKWIEYVVPPDSNIENNAQWYQHLTDMQDNYLAVLSRLLDILEQLKDYDSDIDDEKLKMMGQEVSDLIDSMQKRCGALYKLALVTPTFTHGELSMMKEEKEISAQESAARLAALRSSKGLAPVGQS